MLNTSIPELHRQDEDQENPEEHDAELAAGQDGVETGEQANLDSDSDPSQETLVDLATDGDPSLETLVHLATKDNSPQGTLADASPAGATPMTAAGATSSDAARQPPSDDAAEQTAQRGEPAESFGDMLYEFERTHSHKPDEGSKQIEATVVALTAESVFLDIGFKTEGIISLAAFAGSPSPPQLGDKLRVTIKSRNEEGYYEVSLLKIAQPKDWSALEAAYAEKAIVAGTVTATVKGGLTVDVGVRAFLPASRSGTRDATEMEKLVGQEIRCRITKLDVADEDVVIDRRVVLEEEERATRDRRYSEMSEGDLVTGTVRSLTDYGAFVDIGGVDALLHVSDVAWTRVAAPGDVLSVGQQIEAKILKIEPGKRRISIGLKQLQPHPWDSVPGKYTAGERVTGVVTRLTDFGAFVELAPGIEGLVHISEMSWAKKVRKPGDMVNPGDKVEVVILSVNPEERRISLGLKQTLGDPWVMAADRLFVGAVVEGPIVSFTSFGAFLQVAEGVEGMIHISEIVPDKRLNHPQDELRLGQIVKAQVLEVDRGKRQLKLSIKQLIPSGLEEYIAEHAVGDTVSGRVIEASAERMMVELGEGIRVACKLPSAATSVTVPAPVMAAKPDLSALSSMLKTKWKRGADAPANAGSDNKGGGIRAGEIRSFRIAALDPAAKTIELEAL